jgi:hypothetical protein
MHNSRIKYNIVVDTSMSKPYITIFFVFLSILISSLNSQLNNIVLLAEGQQQQSSISDSTKNVTELIKSNSKKSSIILENKTVNYFDNATGYLVYPISKTISSSIKSNISANNNNTFPVVVMIHENKGLNENGITNQIYIYKGVGHAFANPSGDNYTPQETQDAWEKTISFLKKYLK